MPSEACCWNGMMSPVAGLNGSSPDLAALRQAAVLRPLPRSRDRGCATLRFGALSFCRDDIALLCVANELGFVRAARECGKVCRYVRGDGIGNAEPLRSEGEPFVQA